MENRLAENQAQFVIDSFFPQKSKSTVLETRAVTETSSSRIWKIRN